MSKPLAVEHDEDTDIKGYVLYTDSDIKIIDHTQREEARFGFPIKAGTTFNFNPFGYAVYVYADGSSATVNYYGQKIKIGEMG